MKSIVAAVLVFSLPCLADTVLHTQEPAAVSLTGSCLTAQEDAELLATTRTLQAPYGVRREDGREQFSSSVAVSLGEVFLVRDARQGEHRVRVTMPKDGFVRVELLNAKKTLGLRAPARFRNTTATVNGVATPTGLGKLVLNADGTYRVGQSSGTWVIEDDVLRLRGAMAYWGVGRTTDGGQSLVFSYRRGPMDWVVRYERVEDDSMATR
jgi:hypothetical protein